MTPEEFDRLAIDYLHQALPADEFARLKAHLAADPASAARLLLLADQELLLIHALRDKNANPVSLATDAACETATMLMPATAAKSMKSSRRLRSASKRQSARARKSTPTFAWFSVAALVAVCVLAAWRYLPKSPEASKPAAPTLAHSPKELPKLAPPRSSPVLATLTSAPAGTLIVHDGTAVNAGVGAVLVAHDVARSPKPAEGTAEIAYPDGTLVSLAPESAVEIGDSRGGKHLALLSGSLACKAARQPAGEPFILHTLESDSTVMGTVFELATGGGATTLKVHDGLVKLADLATHESVQVGAGEMAVADNRRKLTVSKINPVQFAETYVQDFRDEGAMEFGETEIADLPPGAKSTVRALQSADKRFFMVRSKAAEAAPYFIVHDDDVVHVTFKADKDSQFELFLCLHPKEGWAFECNLINRVFSTNDKWQTVDIPLSKFGFTGTQQPDGLICRSWFVQSFGERNLRIAKFWVTRQGQAGK